MSKTDTPFRLPRDRLVRAITADRAPVVVVEGAAGTGKTWLLHDLAAAGETRPMLDLAPGAIAQLPKGPVIVALRPGTQVDGLARAEVYGRVSRHDDLLFAPSELPPGLFERTGGWACLIPAARTGAASAAAIEEFLRSELLAQIPSAVLVAMDAWLADPTRRPLAAVQALPFVGGPEVSDHLPAPFAVVQVPLQRALRATLAQRAEQAEEASVIAGAQVQAGQGPKGVALYQSIGAWDAALAAVREGGGPFFVHRFGPEAFDTMLAGFPPRLLAEEPVLVLARAIQAIKRGEVQLMRRILTDRWGPEMADAAAVMAAQARYPLEVRFIRLLTRTWEDFDLEDTYLDQAWSLLTLIPAEDDLRRGSFYNAILEFYIRARRFAEAEHVAQRASDHYARVNYPILSFYIDLHRAIIRLFLGHARSAARHAAAARVHLAATPYDSPGDSRLLSLVEACIAYETGHPDPLTRFLALDADALAQGEIWPTIVELVLTYGAQALSEHWSSLAARAFLDRWRVTEARSSQFHMLIDIREVAVIQSAGRWAEAAAKAAALPGRVTQGFVLSGAVATLTDRDEVALALVWLRQLAQVAPTVPGIEQGLRKILDNPHLTARQRVGAEIWLAHVLRRTRRLVEAEAQLRSTLGAVAEEGALAHLSEERVFLTELLALGRLRATLEREAPVRRLIRTLTEGGPGRTAAAQAAGLTRQEARVLHAISEGAANKAAANLLGLSERTVKFHLANLYRKLGVGTRAEAVKAAAALKLVG